MLCYPLFFFTNNRAYDIILLIIIINYLFLQLSIIYQLFVNNHYFEMKTFSVFELHVFVDLVKLGMNEYNDIRFN